MTKDEVRRAVRAGRRRRTPAERAAAAAGIVAQAGPLIQRAPTVFTSYLPTSTEPPVGLLNARLLEQGHTVLVPRIIASDLEWVSLQPDHPTRPGPMGIEDPLGPAVDLVDVAVMLVPALSVDRSGGRVGQGSGYYDRALAGAFPDGAGLPELVAVTFEDEFAQQLPSEWFDVRMHRLLTPARLRTLPTI